MPRNLIALVCWLTFRCNYRCPYCIKYRMASDFQEAPWAAWATAFDRYDNLLIDITGGEPFMYRNLAALVRLATVRHRVAITTNLSMVSDWGLLSCFCHITASFHPSMIKLTEFANLLAQAQKFTHQLTVNFVANPKQFHYLGPINRICGDLAIPLHVERDIQHQYTQNEWALAETWVSPDRVHNLASEVLCSAGLTFAHALPDGTMMPCMVRPNKGNFITDDVAGYDPYRCGSVSTCGGCDYDASEIRSLDGVLLKAGK